MRHFLVPIKFQPTQLRLDDDDTDIRGNCVGAASSHFHWI